MILQVSIFTVLLNFRIGVRFVQCWLIFVQNFDFIIIGIV